ncbi:unnamed protein product [Acanthoscelides obtectus]|uniref:DUF4219 domain-containing protein n=1 Tax=Acanthoscelides obtectus TaxID=200917 RepID=A0A9P0VVJ1_ACAOB|nr:unnamed protein product [Acanthoscelides obtectus]CAH2021386.1 unnamed protein product [Acanthoscelides obtectus]CAK1683582.1 hypothetical protein AOBTE_LOCUS34337 [Acanthoscelides obtectus]CAK1685680.1 hypothetical protein AOBTE_LOCUS35560 [Acanthoscelides obtectus]
MSVAKVSCIDSLSRDNYDTWKIQMRALLVRNDHWSYVSGEIKQPRIDDGDEASTRAVEAWTKGDSKAMSDIILSISPSEIKQVKNCNTSKELWQKLEGIYQSTRTLQRMEEGQDIRCHLNSFFDAVDKLNDMDVEINADLLAIMLL